MLKSTSVSHFCWVSRDAPRMEFAERRSLFAGMLCFPPLKTALRAFYQNEIRILFLTNTR